jgi:hypothetical protein
MKGVLDSQANARSGYCTGREIIRRFGGLSLTLASPSASEAWPAFAQGSPESPLRAELTGAGPDAQNTFENPDAVTTRRLNFEVRGSRWTTVSPGIQFRVWNSTWNRSSCKVAQG